MTVTHFGNCHSVCSPTTDVISFSFLAMNAPWLARHECEVVLCRFCFCRCRWNGGPRFLPIFLLEGPSACLLFPSLRLALSSVTMDSVAKLLQSPSRHRTCLWLLFFLCPCHCLCSSTPWPLSLPFCPLSTLPTSMACGPSLLLLLSSPRVNSLLCELVFDAFPQDGPTA